MQTSSCRVSESVFNTGKIGYPTCCRTHTTHTDTPITTRASNKVELWDLYHVSRAFEAATQRVSLARGKQCKTAGNGHRNDKLSTSCLKVVLSWYSLPFRQNTQSNGFANESFGSQHICQPLPAPLTHVRTMNFSRRHFSF